MPHAVKLMTFGAILGLVPLLGTAAFAQGARMSGEKAGESGFDATSMPSCPRPADAKEVKVVDFDATTAVAKLAVNLGAGRFKLVRIKAWDRPEDPRPLIPVIEAARITQGLLQFYTPNLNADPESAHDSFILMTDMGGGYVCWATPSSLLNEGGYPVAQEPKSGVTPGTPDAPPRAAADLAPRPTPESFARPRAQTSGQGRAVQ